MAVFAQFTQQAQAEVLLNQILQALEHQGVYGQRIDAHAGLTWGYHGGRWSGFAITEDVLTLTNTATNYLVVARSSGVHSASTSSTNWADTDNYARVYKLTTAGGVVTAVEDHRAGEHGVHGGGVGGGGGSGLSNVATLVQSQGQFPGRFVAADGSIRNPLLRGTGVFTVGTPFTITDDSAYNSWPGGGLSPLNQVAAVYTKGNDHAVDGSSRAVIKYGSAVLVGNPTFGSEEVVYDHASIGVSQRGYSFDPETGREFVTIIRADTGGAITGVAGHSYRDPGGAWTFVDDTAATGFTQEAYAAGPIFKLPDGRHAMPVEGTDTGDTPGNRWSKLIFSSDGGATFAGPVTVANYSTGSRVYVESVFGVVHDPLSPLGYTILAIHRCSPNSGGPGHYENRSTDGGASFTTPVFAFAGYGAPGWCVGPSGTMLATTRKNSGAGVIGYSRVGLEGAWSASFDIDVSMSESEYATPLVDVLGRWLVIYGSQPSGATTNADIKGVHLAEGVVEIQAGIPQTSKSAAYTLLLTDANRHVLHPSADTTARVFTIPANSSVPFPLGTAVTFVNQDSAGVITIAITSDTMRLAGAGTTGSRSLAANGVATALKITATEWIISGTGLS